jgi:hypothetical protein
MVLLYRKPVPQVKNRKKYKKEALKRLFSFEKKNPLTTLQLQLKPWNIA